MQINFEPEKIKAAKAYVSRLNPIELPINTTTDVLNNEKEKSPKLDKDFYSVQKKSSLIQTILNFLFK